MTFNKNENPNYTFKTIPNKNTLIVYHPSSKEISFSYHITQDIKTETPKSKNRPLIQKEYFHILGESLFIIPDEIFDEKIDDPKIIANIEWINFPKKFVIHNTFGSNQLKQKLNVKLWSEFYRSLFVGGDYRIKKFKHLEKPIYLAIRGKWLGEYTDNSIFNAFKKTIINQREFWNDHNFNYYSLIITPTITQTDSIYKRQYISGTGIKNGFLLQSSNNPFNYFPTLKYMLNHEIMHDWIGGKIAMKNGPLNYWFSEGFTEYFTYKNRLRSKDLTLEGLVKEFNTEIIKAHWENPERNKPNYIIEDDFWNNRNIEKLPYRRGAIFAFWLDNQILKKSNYTQSLDNVMRDILQTCTSQNKKFTDELFLQIVKKYLESDITYFFQKHIINGVDIKFENANLIDGFKIEYFENVPQILVINTIDINYILKN